MKAIAIPRKKFSGDLVIIARKEYEHLLTLAHDRAQLNKGLRTALTEVHEGKTVGPFASIDELMESLTQ